MTLVVQRRHIDVVDIGRTGRQPTTASASSSGSMPAVRSDKRVDLDMTFNSLNSWLLDDEADIAVIDALGADAGGAVDLVQAAQQDRLPVGGDVEPVERRRQLLLVDRARRCRA